jgi:hypothetical protein
MRVCRYEVLSEVELGSIHEVEQQEVYGVEPNQYANVEFTADASTESTNCDDNKETTERIVEILDEKDAERNKVGRLMAGGDVH